MIKSVTVSQNKGIFGFKKLCTYTLTVVYLQSIYDTNTVATVKESK